MGGCGRKNNKQRSWQPSRDFRLMTSVNSASLSRSSCVHSLRSILLLRFDLSWTTQCPFVQTTAWSQPHTNIPRSESASPCTHDHFIQTKQLRRSYGVRIVCRSRGSREPLKLVASSFFPPLSPGLQFCAQKKKENARLVLRAGHRGTSCTTSRLEHNCSGDETRRMYPNHKIQKYQVPCRLSKFTGWLLKNNCALFRRH